MDYRQHIAALLRQLADSGLTQRQIADKLGFPNENVISMHLASSSRISPYPLKRLPALVDACGADATVALQLLAKRALHHPRSPTEIDETTHLWQVQVTVAAVSIACAARAAGGSHA